MTSRQHPGNVPDGRGSEGIIDPDCWAAETVRSRKKKRNNERGGKEKERGIAHKNPTWGKSPRAHGWCTTHAMVAPWQYVRYRNYTLNEIEFLLRAQQRATAEKGRIGSRKNFTKLNLHFSEGA